MLLLELVGNYGNTEFKCLFFPLKIGLAVQHLYWGRDPNLFTSPHPHIVAISLDMCPFLGKEVD